MANHPYREPFQLDTDAQFRVEKLVLDQIKAMAAHTKIPEGELVTTALRRFIATHSDYFPKDFTKTTKKN